ncbi:MAG TPA: DUF1275 family protein [Rhodocyclaceae bacterium]|jgi:uncharacterized membrane protein YoaK (UPF0700 family)|nr:DUF1275 family protein [Rhodocyclaceae bacterium]
MTKYGLKLRLLAIALSALSGYVDALGFINLGGFFISFMSGNSTRLGVGLVGDTEHALISGGLILAFVFGVILGSLVAHRSSRNRACTVLLLVSVLLAVAAACHTAELPAVAIAITALAMGAINVIFVSNGEVSTGVTYMTGTLVKLGQGLARALVSDDKVAWGGYLLLWLGLLSGAMLGAFVYPRMELAGLWFAAGAAAVLAVVTTRMSFDHR